MFNVIGWMVGFMFYPFVLVSTIVFQSIQIGIPIHDLMTWLFTPLLYLNGIFPVTDLISGMTVLLVFYGWVYLSRFILWLISLLPFMHNLTLPFHTGEQKGPLRN